MKRAALFIVILALALVITACDDDYSLEDQLEASLTKIHTDRNYFMDQHGRYLFIHGINVSGSTKVPTTTDPISYVGKPFPLEEADWNFSMLRKMGFNTLRLLIIWEAIEPYESGQYDQDYLDYIEQIVAKANEYGIYVVMDMHQDLFSRHLMKMFDDGSDQVYLVDPEERSRGLSWGLNNKVQGDGAPAWAVQLCLPEKNVNGPYWGLPDEYVPDSVETTDFYSMPLWGVNIFISMDVVRSFATFFAGRDVYPNYTVNGVNVQDYLQNSYAESWRQIAARVGKYPNVIGYDIINEPAGIYVMFSVYALLYREAAKSESGVIPEDRFTEVVDEYLSGLMDQGASADAIQTLRDIWLDYDVLPRSLTGMTESGFVPQQGDSPHKPDIGAAFALNFSFNKNYLQPFHERVGKVIQEEDPDAIIFIELSLGLPDTGISGWYASPMLRPEGIDQIAFAPHYYTDIYPFIGYGEPERDFTPEEKRFRDYAEGINGAIEASLYSLGNPPTMMGEFGTYFNFGGIEKSIANDYLVSSYVLDIYFEHYEEMLLHHTMWTYSPENTKENGENWNKEDFSVLDSERKPRSEEAWSRVYPRFTSGRLLKFHYNSPLHYYDPRPGEPTPYMEFQMEMASKETGAPTEIFVPPLIFTKGFYVYISDGRCVFDPDAGILYWYPSADDPEHIHTITVRPPYEDYGDYDWDYFFDGEQILEGRS